MFEVPERFGVRDVVTDAQTEEVFKAGAVEDLLLGGVIAEAVELLQHEDFEHEHGVEGGLTALSPVAGGVAGEFFEQRAETLPGDDVTQFEDASGLGCHGLFVLNGGEQSATPFCFAVTLHHPFYGSRLCSMKALPGEMRFPEVPVSENF